MIVKNIASTAVFRANNMAKTDLVAGEHIFAGLNCFEVGQEHQLHTHEGQDKLYLVLEGNGVVTVRDQSSRVDPGDLVLAKSNEPHALRNPGPDRLVVMAVMAPPPRR
jgi:quercetin dioxygenase-like cupin family protein